MRIFHPIVSGWAVAALIMTQIVFAEVASITVSLAGIEDVQSGRLFIVFTQEKQTEPRLTIGDNPSPRTASHFFAVDVENWDGEPLEFTPSAGFPLNSPAELARGNWRAQALFDVNEVLSDLDSPGNRFSLTQTVAVADGPISLQFNLSETVPAEQLPEETELLKFVRIRSELLSTFYGEKIFLRASVLLPAAYEPGSSERYPVLFHVAGLNGLSLIHI